MPIHWRLSRSAATQVVPHPTKRIKHNITFVARRFDDAFQQRKRFLGGVAGALFLATPDRRKLCPPILNRFTTFTIHSHNFRTKSRSSVHSLAKCLVRVFVRNPLLVPSPHFTLRISENSVMFARKILHLRRTRSRITPHYLVAEIGLTKYRV